MKIYTSYFSNARNLAKEQIQPISIARYSPRWFTGPRYTSLAPTSYMISTACSREEYLRKYNDILNSLSPQAVISYLSSISNGKDIALCCYEKPGDFCHRHLLAEWLKRNGYKVEEWTAKGSKEQSEQLSLFD